MKKTNYNLKRTPSLEARRYDLKRNPGLKIKNVLSVVKLNKNIGEILLSLVQHKKKRYVNHKSNTTPCPCGDIYCHI